MANLSLSEQLARSNAELELGNISPEVIGAAKLHILDSIGCLLSGSKLGPGKLACELAATIPGAAGAPSSIFGTHHRASYPDAVQAMSVAAHCGEMDDIHGGAGVCIGAMIVPALLGIVEKFAGSGKRLIEAAVAGYETVIRVGLSIDAPKLFARGWWPSTVCGAFGVAAAGAKFMGWSPEKTANALGIATLHSGGMITGGSEGATARHLAFGHAARNGIASLLATEQGFTGPRRAFEDPRGFCPTLFSEPKYEHLQNFTTFHLPEVAFKPYPCARQLHAGVEALLRLLQRRRLTWERLEVIELAVPTANASMVDRPTITLTHAATVGSGQYVMAVTALRGKIDLKSFDTEFLESTAVRTLMANVKLVAGKDLDCHFPKYWPGRVTVRSGGEIYSEEVIIPKGETENPMQPSEIKDKFVSQAAPIIGEKNANSLIREMESLEQCDSLMSVISLLKPSS